MKLIGLTGGSGVGKGYVCEEFARRGVRSIDCDRVSRAVMTPDSPCVRELTDRFGAGILRPDGSLDRRLLAELALPDPVRRADLNRITHAYIVRECDRLIAEAAAAGEKRLILDAPTLFESGIAAKCDVRIAVLADHAVRLARILARDALTRDAALHRLNAQPDDGFYLERCEYVIRNNGTESVPAQVAAILAALDGARGGQSATRDVSPAARNG